MNSTIFNSEPVILESTSSITKNNSNLLAEMLITEIQFSDYNHYLLDMQKVEILDNTGLMTLMTVFRFAQSLGKKISLCSLTPAVQIIFDLMPLDWDFSHLEIIKMGE